MLQQVKGNPRNVACYSTYFSINSSIRARVWLMLDVFTPHEGGGLRAERA
jgi:hypothetical protein